MGRLIPLLLILAVGGAVWKWRGKLRGWVVDGFLLGMVLGPIGWLAAFLGAKDSSNENEKGL